MSAIGRFGDRRRRRRDYISLYFQLQNQFPPLRYFFFRFLARSSQAWRALSRNKNPANCGEEIDSFAETARFELAIPFWGIHTFSEGVLRTRRAPSTYAVIGCRELQNLLFFQPVISINRFEKMFSLKSFASRIEFFEVEYFQRSSCLCRSNIAFVMLHKSLS